MTWLNSIIFRKDKTMQETIKPPVELRYQEELEALKKVDEEQGNKKPDNWQMSPKAVRTFILGSEKPIKYKRKNISIKKKYFGNDALVERCIVTLAGNRGLMVLVISSKRVRIPFSIPM